MACDKVTAEMATREGDNNAEVKENDYVETGLLEVACEQALLFGQAKRASRERASEGRLAASPLACAFSPDSFHSPK